MVTILAIDDKRDNLTSAAALLGDLIPECTVLTALSGDEGVRLAREAAPDAVLLDIRMPGMDGFEVCRRLKADPLTSPIPIILLTAARTDVQSRVRGLDAGADAFLSKPIDPAELTAQVKVALRIKRSEDELRAQRDTLEFAVKERTAELEAANAALRRSKSQLGESERFLRASLDSLSANIAIVDEKGRILFVNRAWKNFARENGADGTVDAEGGNYFSVCEHAGGPDAESASEFLAGMHDVLTGRRPSFRMEYPCHGPDHRRWFLAQVTPLAGNEGTRIVVAHENITQQKTSEEWLRESEARYRAVFDNVQDAILVFDREGRVIEVNPAATALYGYGRDEFLRLRGRDFVHEDYYEVFEQFMEKVPRLGSFSGQSVDVRKDGSEFEIEVTGTRFLYRGEDCLLAVIRDVTLRNRTLRALEDRHRELEQIFDAIPEALVWTDPQRRIVRVNPAFTRIYGYEPDEVLGRETRILYASDEGFEEQGRARFNLESRATYRPFETEYRRKNGEVFSAEVVGTPVRDSQDRVIGMLGLVRDITERKKAEQALRDSEARVRRKLDAILLPEGDLGELELADIVDAEAFRSLMDDFCDLTGFAVAVVDTKGKVLVAKNWQTICTSFHRVHPETAQHCLQSDTLLSSGVAPGEFKLYRCKNGMWDIATPLFLGEKHLGNIFMGQFFFAGEEVDVESFRQRARGCGFDETEYLDALSRVPRWTRADIDRVMHFYSSLAGLISKLGYGNVRLAKTLAERERAEAELRMKSGAMENALNGFIIVSEEERIVYVNQAFLENWGYDTKEELVGTSPVGLWNDPGMHDEIIANLRKHGRFNSRYLARRKDGSVFWTSMYARVDEDEEHRRIYLGSCIDITDRVEAARRQELYAEILSTLNHPNEWRALIDDLLGQIKDYTRFEGVGIRLRSGDDYPYFVFNGYSADFIEAERSLCRVETEGGVIRDGDGNLHLHCLCGDVIQGRTDAAKPWFTEGGSFWTNDIAGLAARNDRPESVDRARMQCLSHGYSSLALIPLRAGKETIGLLQFNAAREDAFTRDLIEFFEQIGVSIGIAFTRKRIDEELRRREQWLSSIFRVAPAGIGVVADRVFRQVNERVCEMTGYSEEELLNQSARILYPTDEDFDYVGREKYTQIRQRGTGTIETRWRRKDGRIIDVRLSSTPMDPDDLVKGVTFTALDITEEKLNENLVRMNVETLERMARKLSLDDILRPLLEEVDSVLPDNRSSIELLSSDGAFLRFFLGPHLPQEWIRLIDPMEIGPKAGSCGTAAFRNERVVVRDIATDPLWESVRDDALAAGFAACWSEPIRDDAGEVIGTFAMYLGEAREPSERELRVLESISGLIATVIQSVRRTQSLRESQERYQLVNQATHDIIWDWDLLTDRLDWNEAIEAAVGRSRAEMPRTIDSWYDHLHPADRDRVVAGIHAKIEAGERYWSDEYLFGPVDGPYRIYFDRGFIMRDAEGQPCRMIGSMLDVTEQRRAERALRQSEHILARTESIAHVGSWEWDIEGERIVWSDELFRIFGLDPARGPLPFDDYPSLYPAEDMRRLRDAIEAALARGTPFSLELHALRGDGAVRVVHSRGFTDSGEDGRPVRLYGFVQDITERKKSEEELKEYRDHLEELVAERTEEIARRSAELEVANAELEAFSYSVSHDLRAPLRRMDGFSQTLFEGYAASVDERGRHFLERIRANARQMGNLIDDLLKLSRVSRGEMRYEPVDLSDLAGRIAAELRSGGRDRDVRFDIRPDLVDRGDPRLIEAAMRNLLANAWKFTAKTERAVIEFGATENARCESPDEELEGDAVVYFVRDNGAGFDMAYADKLFAPFQRLHRADEFEGSGIGLATVQRIIRRHGGRIWARGAVGSGAAFYFTLSPIPEKDIQ